VPDTVERTVGTAKKKPTTVRSTRPQAEDDVFGAAGGVPVVPMSMPGSDLSKRQSIRELTWGEFDRHVEALARAASKFKPQVVVGLVQGGMFVGGAIASALRAEFIPVRVTRRHRESVHTARDTLPPEIKGQRVLLVDDIAKTGDTLAFATQLARAAGVTKIKTATLISRPDGFQPDFVALTASDFFVFPWDYEHVVDDNRYDTGEHRIPPTGR
jgi:hypoxanthine phosphoribosyltransferase